MEWKEFENLLPDPEKSIVEAYNTLQSGIDDLKYLNRQTNRAYYDLRANEQTTAKNIEAIDLTISKVMQKLYKCEDLMARFIIKKSYGG